MTDEATCGTGMAASAVLPTRMAEVVAAMADVLTRHTESLNPGEPAAEAEREAWLAIAAEQRQIARHLTASADRMEAQRELPLADHDMAALTSPDATSAFAHFVTAQERLSDLLTEQLVEYRSMLADIRGTDAEA